MDEGEYIDELKCHEGLKSFNIDKMINKTSNLYSSLF